jgi:NTE family protein
MFALFFIFLIFLSLTSHAQTVLPESHNCQLGITLSGGAARGYAHIGVLRAFEEAGIEIDYISGASMGSIIGAMYAYGYSPKEMIAIIEKEKLYKISKIFNLHLFNRKGISNHKKIKKILNNTLPVNNFDSLKRFFALSMTNFIDLETEYAFSGDQLKEKITASAAIPSVFEPVVIDGIIYIDGGMMNNLPIEPIKDKCQKIIMIDVTAVSKQMLTSGKIKIGYRAGLAMMKQMNAARIAQADYYVGLEKLERYNPFDFRKYKAIIQIGYEGMKQYLEEHPELKN